MLKLHRFYLFYFIIFLPRYISSTVSSTALESVNALKAVKALTGITVKHPQSPSKEHSQNERKNNYFQFSNPNIFENINDYIRCPRE